jgi:hypothetical protein
MSTNFKATIRNRYKGRGNCWVKVPSESVVYSTIVSSLNNVNASEYLGHIDREGFAWIRFIKPSGSQNEPLVSYEVRYRGSKFDHPDNIITVADNIAKDLPLLGNTPVKLQLEVDPSVRKLKENKPTLKKQQSEYVSLNVSETVDIRDRINVIEVASLSKPSSKELSQWRTFLLEEGLLDYTC